MTRTGTQLSAPLWRASGARCPTHCVPLACPQLAWDASHIWPGPQTIVCAGRSQEESAPFEGDCGSCWAEAGDSPHGTLNSETHPGLQVPCKTELVEEAKAEMLRVSTNLSGIILCSPCGGLNNGPQICPHPNPHSLCICYLTWQNGLCRCD